MVKVGIIGMGIRGKLYADTIQQNPFAKISGICDNNTEILISLGKKYETKIYTDYREMIDNTELDAVIVATPDFLHRDSVIYTANRKIHLMVEKPFSTLVKDCEDMVAAIQKNEVKCLVAFENRWSLPFIAAKNKINAGETGDILQVMARLSNTIYVPTQMLKWSKDTTPAWFLFPHIVDMVCWLTGKEVKSVYGTGIKKKLKSVGFDTYDAIQSIITFEDGSSAVFLTNWILPDGMPVIADQRLEITGERSSIVIDLQEQMIRHITETGVSNPRVLGTPIYGKLNAPPCHMLNSFIDCIKDNTDPLVTEVDGLKNTVIIAAIHESIKKGCPIVI